MEEIAYEPEDLSKKQDEVFEKQFKKHLGLQLSEFNAICSPENKINSIDDLKVKLDLLMIYAKHKQTLSVQSKGALKLLAIGKQKVENRFIKFKKAMGAADVALAVGGAILTILAFTVLGASTVSGIGIGFFLLGLTLFAISQLHSRHYKPTTFKKQTIYKSIKSTIRNFHLQFRNWQYLRATKEYDQSIKQLDALIQHLNILKKQVDENKNVDQNLLNVFTFEDDDKLSENINKSIERYTLDKNSLEATKQSRTSTLKETIDKISENITKNNYRKEVTEAKWIDYHNMFRTLEGLPPESKSLRKLALFTLKIQTTTSSPNRSEQIDELLKDLKSFKPLPKELAKIPEKLQELKKLKGQKFDKEFKTFAQNLTKITSRGSYKDLLTELPETLVTLRLDEETTKFLEEEMDISPKHLNNPEELLNGLKNFVIGSPYDDFRKERQYQKEAEEELKEVI